MMTLALLAASTFSMTDVAKHSSKTDCWVAIEGSVYDISTYVAKHPAPVGVLVDACGKDATEGWKTKGNKAKPHSRKAEVLLKSFLKGKLSE
jgi:cytochrome b involved in lipid metabolism